MNVTKEQAEAQLNGIKKEYPMSFVRAYIAHLEGEVKRKDEALRLAIDRINDMLMGDDGQAWKEARKALPRIEAALTNTGVYITGETEDK